MKKIFAMILVAVMALALFASCGKTEKEMVVVGYTIYAPMNYEDESGKLVGFDTELAEAVFDKLGYNVVFKEIDWGQKYMELDGKTVDCLWNGFTANTSDDDGVARSAKVDFSYNYMLNKQAVIVKTSDAAAFTDKASFADKVGVAEKGSAGLEYMGEFEGCIQKDAESQLDALRALTLGTADFVILDDQLANAYVGKGDYQGLTKIEDLASDSEYYAIGFRKGSELTALVNGALEALAKDGTIARLAEKYGVSNTAITDFSDQK